MANPPPDKLQQELFPDIIRAETVLSRNPIHQLTTGSPIDIDIQQTDDAGRVSFLWQVAYNSKHRPGRLAYKLDTLIVNRRIEEAGRPVPATLRLGSLRDICAELGVNEGKATMDVKRALLQNAATFITARLSYKGHDGSEHTFEFNDSRYGITLTGKKRPDGRKADAVYLHLHDAYRALLDRAPIRPLNYDYLRALSPLAQRFYELVSFRVYGALLHDRPTARYLYSEFSTYAPQARYTDWESVRKQMYKVHKPHLDAGYLAKVEWEEAAPDAKGLPDWCFIYTPGPAAIDEFNSFSARKQPRRTTESSPRPRRRSIPSPPTDALPLEPGESPLPEADAELVALLVAQELNRADAERLARERPDECRRQLEFLPHVSTFKSSRGAYLRSAIEGGFGPPKGYAATQARQHERHRQTETSQQETAAAERRAAEECAWDEWWAALPPDERQAREERARKALAATNATVAAIGAKKPDAAVYRAALREELKKGTDRTP